MARVAAVGRVAVAGRVAIPQTENLVLDNRNLASANWTPIATTVATGFSDPFGGVQAAELTETAAVNVHTHVNTGSILIPVAAEELWGCVSAFMRPGTRNFGGFFMDLGTASVIAFWDLTTGAATFLSSTAGMIVEAQQLTPETFSDGWRRYAVCWRNLRPPASGFFAQYAMSSDGLTLVYLGDVTRNIRVFAPGYAWANRPGPVTDTTAGVISARIRNEARGRVAP